MKLQLLLKQKKIYPKEIGNMIWYPNTPSPEERMKLKMWRQVKPLILDKLCLASFQGVITSRIRKKSMKVNIQILGFHRLLSFANQTIGGRTTSRYATPLGDGRGVPKHFQDFGRFSKCSSKCSCAFSQPALLEGFALRSRKPLSVFCSRDPSGTVTVLLVRGPDSSLTLIRTDITKMAQEDLSSVDSLFSLVESMDFDPQMEDLGESIMTEEELEANLPNDFFSTDPIPLPPPSSPPQTPPPSPVLRLSSTSSNAPLQLRQVGPNTFEVVTDALQLPLDAPLDLGYGSLPSAISSSSSIPPPSPPSDVSRISEINEESREERRLRLQADACRRHRQNKKRKLEEEQKELKLLQRKNVELRAKFKATEEMVARLRCTVMEVVSGKRKRDGKEEEDERAGGKSRRI